MRRLFAGVLLLLSIPAAAIAQFKGEVESIGFDSYYRPNCHVPMLIRIQSQTSGTYQIQVVQEDLDRDLQVFAQTISLTGADDGKGSEQRFWMYFVPQPASGGLPEPGDGLRTLQQQLKVFLCDETGEKQLAQLPVTSTIQNLDNHRAGFFDAPRGNRMILAVAEGVQPIWRDYQQAIGTMENVVFVTVRASQLPEDVRGFEMVDGIVWLAAPLPDPRRPSDEKRFRAIQDYVRGGGHLVICQPAQRDATATVAEMLPVNVLSVEPRQDLEPLRSIAKRGRQEEEEPTAEATPTARPPTDPENPLPDEPRRRPRDDWSLPTGPFMFARAQAKPHAIVVDQLKWKEDGSDASPYIARHGYGSGCVTWVAHDLSDPSITNRARSGWPFVWDRVLDYKHDLTIVDANTPQKVQQLYASVPGVELSASLIERMQLTAKSRTLISIAVVFFIAYWAIAGPGVYFYLLTRSRPQISWFMFAFSAVAATLLTVLVVKLVVRGAPEMAHITVVRGGIGTPQVSMTRMGLYIPDDGPQEIALPEVAPRQVSYVTADQRHPRQAASDIEFPAQQKYAIPVNDLSEEGPVKITVPFRSTAKEFTARRVGPTEGAVEGAAKLRETEGANLLEGKITNGTGARLRNVYVIYHDPYGDRGQDVALYLPALEKSQSVDLRDLNFRELKKFSLDQGPQNATPRDNVRLWGVIGNPGIQVPNAWVNYWCSNAGANQVGETQYRDLSRALPMMSVFNRLPPLRNGWRDGGDKNDRFELFRRGGRYLDCSNVVAAGQLLVIGEADDDAGKQPPPVPYPLEVWGNKVEGKGTVYYQFALPMERIAMPPATQPSSTQPATAVKPGTQPAVTAKVESY